MTSSEITGRTRILGLIADPVAQARSPGLANALLRQRGHFGTFVLVPMQVPIGFLAGVVAALRDIHNFAGAIVSMPHKSAIVPLLDELAPEARLVGAVNVLARTPDGRLLGNALDGEGFVGGLWSAGHEAKGTVCLLVGAGGAASAIAFALARHGCASLDGGEGGGARGAGSHGVPRRAGSQRGPGGDSLRRGDQRDVARDADGRRAPQVGRRDRAQ